MVSERGEVIDSAMLDGRAQGSYDKEYGFWGICPRGCGSCRPLGGCPSAGARWGDVPPCYSISPAGGGGSARGPVADGGAEMLPSARDAAAAYGGGEAQ
eukprot:7174289-Prymnesium_polylepis.1